MAINFLNNAIGTAATFTGDLKVAGGLLFADQSSTRVGIGTLFPDELLHVDGPCKIRGLLKLDQNNQSTFAGVNAGNLTNIIGSKNTAFGRDSLSVATSNSNNVAVGFEALKSSNTGNNNVAIGAESMSATTDSNGNNVAIGYQAAKSTNGARNVAIGAAALLANVNGIQNTAIGDNALSSLTGNGNTALGYQAGSNLTNAQNNVIIGYQAQAGAATVQNQIVIGKGAVGDTTNNSVVIGNDAIAKTILKGAIVVPSYGAGTLVTDAAGNITASSGGGAGGPYLPLTGGTLTGALTGTSATFAGEITASKNQNATSTFTFQNTDTTNTNSRANLNVTAGNRSINLLAINDDHLYLSRTSATNLYIQRGSSTDVIIDSTGNVGIGTTSPDAKLEVAGIVKINTGADASNPRLYFQQDDIDVNNFIEVDRGSNAMEFWNNGSERMRISSAGNVGIGTVTTSPYRLNVLRSDGNVAFLTDGATADLAITCIGGVTDLSPTTGVLAFGTSSTERMRITSGGNVGIGTDSPDSLLNLEGVKNTSIITLGSTTNNSSWSVGDRVGGIDFYSGDGSGAGSGIKASISYEVEAGVTGSTNSMVFRASGTTSGTKNLERMRIDSNGNVGIGTASPAAAAKLTVMGNQTFGLPGNGTNTSSRFISIEGNADSSGEGSSRVFFTEHNSSTAAMDKYGMSLGYRGGSTSIVGASGNTWTGLTQLNNGEWGMFGHDNNAVGVKIMQGSRSATYTAFYSGGSETMRVTGGDVGIGATSPNQKLHVNGATQLGDINATVNFGTVALKVVEGTISSGPTLGVGNIGAQAVLYSNGLFGMYTGVSSNGSTWMQSQRNDASTATYNILLNPLGGNVGIGTTSPNEKLEIVGNARISNSNTGASSTTLRIGAYSVNNNTKYGGAIRSYHNFGLTYDADLAFFANADNERMRITGAGNVGIGTTTPGEKLSVDGNIFLQGSDDYIAFNTSASSGHPKIKMNSDADFSFLNTAGSNTFHIENGGNVGIGTTTPGEKLTVSGNGRFSNGSQGTLTIKHNYGYLQPNWGIKLDGDTNTSGGYLSQYINLGGFALNQGGTYYGGGPHRTDANSTSFSSVSGVNGEIVFYTNTSLTANANFTPAERMRITSNGTVDIAAKDLIIDDVNEHREEFTATGNQSISFDVDMKSIGASGQPFEVFVGWTHYSTGYGASLHQAFFQRSTAQSNITLIHTYFQQASSNGGSWGVSYINATTIRVTKTAGMHSGSGYGYLRVTQLKP